MDLRHSQTLAKKAMRKYRESWVPLLVGLVFLLVPIVLFSVPAIFYFISGDPMLVNNKGSMSPHIASQREIITTAFMPLILSFLGLLMVINWRKSGVQTDVTGIRKFRSTGQMMFSATWPELVSVAKINKSSGISVFVVKTEHGRMDFSNVKGRSDGLIAEIREKAPQIDFSPWS